jgi:drug/metabolite transporter (DMT)-like permease
MIKIFWGFALLASGIVANKIILLYVPPILSVALRMIIAGSILLAFALRRTHNLRWSYIKHDALALIGAGTLTTLVPAILKAYALKNMLSSKAAFLGSLDPFVTALYAYVFWKETLNWQKILGIIVGFAGALIMLLASAPAEADLLAWGRLSYPELAALAAMALGRLGWMVVQKLMRSNRYTAAEMSSVSMLFSGTLAIILSLYYEPVKMICLDNAGSLFGALFWTAIVGNVIAYTMYTNFLKHYSSTFISLTGFSVPVFVYFYGWVLLGEPLTWSFIASISVTLIGVLIFYSAEIKKPSFFTYRK